MNKDAISRETLIAKLTELIKTSRSTIEIKAKLIPMIQDLPSVTQIPKYWIDKDNKIYKMPDDIPQRSGKWDRLYSWLNDMRLSIAPDETVTDIDERNCREAQTDILDEIMEWMIKAED